MEYKVRGERPRVMRAAPDFLIDKTIEFIQVIEKARNRNEQIDRQTDRQKDAQKDTHTHTHRGRQRETETDHETHRERD